MNKIALKRQFLMLILILIGIFVNAQNFSIKGIEKLQTDMDARVNFPRKDQNGKTCAIIKIATPLTGFSFDTGTLQVQYVVEKTGEIWVYVQPGVRKITIAHQSLGVVREWEFPIKIEEACSYALSITQTQLSSRNITDTNISPSGNPKRKVLLTLRRHELLEAGECLLSFKSSVNHFACIIKDTLTNKSSLIIDGVKRVQAKYIETLYIDPSDYNKCILLYKDNHHITFFIEGKEYGPYIGWAGDMDVGWGDNERFWVYKGIYSVYNETKREWEHFNKGKPYVKEDFKYYASGRKRYKTDFKIDTLTSVNKKFMARSLEFGTVTINNHKIRIIPKQEFNDTWSQSIVIQDDGKCIVEISREYFPTRIFVVQNGRVTELSQDQFYNYRTSSIDTKGNEEMGIFAQSFYSLPNFKNEPHIIYDSTNNHSIETCGLYNHVLIDNKEYGKECALEIFYNDERNEFIWTALEGKELVMYQYKL